MAKDFTISVYQSLLHSLKEADYRFQSFAEFLEKPAEKSIVLRHDVDAKAHNSLQFARMQADMEIKGVYYFRAVPQSWKVPIIEEIAALGHEIGYHYECLTTSGGDMKLGIADFEKNLNALRRLAPVSTICMHGSPMSRYDSKDLWKNYDYQNFGIVGEPYFDTDFQKVFYLTDTGRSWDGGSFSVRDKVDSAYNLKFRYTHEIIKTAHKKELPDQIMFTFHPQRWTDNKVEWWKEMVLQNIKNSVKKHFFVKKN